MKNYKKGFTLAEVLVTLGIIGVVSAMTVPNLVRNYQNKALVNQLHKVYTEFSQAIELYMSDQKVESMAETELYNNNDGLKSFINNYFKVVSDCGNNYISSASGAKCFSSDPYYAIDDDSHAVLSGNLSCVGMAFTLASGAAICAETGEDFPLYLEVDVNGAQPPNVFGRDLFVLFLNMDGEFYDYDYIQNGYTTKFTGANSRTGAFGRIMNDGWEMNY